MPPAEDQKAIPTRTELGWPLGVGAALGAASLALDELSGPVGDVLRGMGGGAFAWGFGALLVAYHSRHRSAAQQRATVLLVTATLVYYGLILVVGHRWRGATLADGGSALWVSVASVGRAVLLWLIGAVLAGAVLGWLGVRIRSASRYAGAVAAGLATGVLGSQAVALAVTAIGMPSLDRGAWRLLTTAGVTLVLATAAPATMLGLTNHAPPWWAYLTTAAGATGLGAATWIQIEAVRSVISL